MPPWEGRCPALRPGIQPDERGIHLTPDAHSKQTRNVQGSHSPGKALEEAQGLD